MLFPYLFNLIKVLNCLYSHLSQKDVEVLSKNILKSFFKHTSEIIHLIINKTNLLLSLKDEKLRARFGNQKFSDEVRMSEVGTQKTCSLFLLYF